MYLQVKLTSCGWPAPVFAAAYDARGLYTMEAGDLALKSPLERTNVI